jgi:hypothetical protein
MSHATDVKLSSPASDPDFLGPASFPWDQWPRPTAGKSWPSTLYILVLQIMESLCRKMTGSIGLPASPLPLVTNERKPTSIMANVCHAAGNVEGNLWMLRNY